MHVLIQTPRKACTCGSEVSKRYICDASGEVIDIAFRCILTNVAIDIA